MVFITRRCRAFHGWMPFQPAIPSATSRLQVLRKSALFQFVDEYIFAAPGHASRARRRA